ncbi:hypothetical protein DH2020_042461 [Rehmannia glutinosa]|uniref:UBN2_2 domain-containing protein n=1 Tax=Rehmannia glutinosa TaxID=99300 RepID=A0ABR0UNP8_REHGL
MNQDFVKLDRLDGTGTNFNRWKDKLMFFLTALKVAYVLNPNLPEIPPPKDGESDEVKKQREKRQEDEVICRGHILNTLSDTLYDLFTVVKSPREIWATLEREYASQKQGADEFLIKKYFEFKLDDSSSLMDQIHNLQVIVSKHKEYGVEISESMQVGAIIAKLPSSWNDYQKKLLHTSEILTISSVLKHLRIEEGARILHKKEFDSDPRVNMVHEKKF